MLNEEDYPVYICEKYRFFIETKLLTHVCDGWEEE
jgi:hypothetical protein